MTERTVDSDIRLIPYYRNDAALLPWYQDPDVCKQVDTGTHPMTWSCCTACMTT